jgi:hypothetical protein
MQDAFQAESILLLNEINVECRKYERIAVMTSRRIGDIAQWNPGASGSRSRQF